MQDQKPGRTLNWPLLLLVMVTFAVYCRIINHEFLLLWDDNFYVTANPDAWGFSWQNIRSAFTRYYIGNYAPVQILSYMLDYSVWGMFPGGFLLTNLLIHVANGLLFYRLLMRWYDERGMALFASAIYLLHPVQVESVAWISQRKNLLSIFFFLLAWEWYCRYRSASSGNKRSFFTMSLMAFFCSLLAKQQTVVFPLILVLFDTCFSEPDRRLRLKDKFPYLLAALVVAALAIYSEIPEVGGGGRTGYHGGSPWTTFLTMLPVFTSYLRMLIWPTGLSAEYAPVIRTGIDGDVVAATLILTGVLVTGWRLFIADRRLGFWFAFFWIGLLPLSQIIPMLSMINDRYLYLPLFGAATLAGCGLLKLKERVGGRYVQLLHALALLLLAVLAAASYNRSCVWHDSLTLFKDVVVKAPGSDRGWRLLADAYQIDGNNNAALATFEQALNLNPDNQTAMVGMGNLLTELGQLNRGAEVLQSLVSKHPEHAAGWMALGDNNLKRGNYKEAEQAYQRVGLLQPGALQVSLRLSDLAIIQGDYAKALTLLERLELDLKYNPVVAYNLARVESLTGHGDLALKWLEKALQLGYGDYETINNNEEFQSVWDSPHFAMLMQHYFPDQTER